MINNSLRGQTGISKDPGPWDPALVYPGGVVIWRYILNGILEWWKNGTMGIKSG